MSREAHPYKLIQRPATARDCLELAPRLRQEDKDEIWESNQYLPLEALALSFQCSTEVYVGESDGEVFCMFGVATHPEDPTIGVPWMLASEHINSVSKEFIKRCRGVVKNMAAPYIVLSNIVWSRNIVHVRWLKWLGFTIDKEPIPLGHNQEIFYKFYMYHKEYQHV